MLEEEARKQTGILSSISITLAVLCAIFVFFTFKTVKELHEIKEVLKTKTLVEEKKN